MSMPTKIKDQIEQLIVLMMTTGVQPSELADNIFLSSYEELRFYKQHNEIIADVIFYQSNDLVTLRYYYNNDKFVRRIESIVYGTVTVEWDRENNEMELTIKLISLLKKYYTIVQINKFITTLPSRIQEQLKIQLLSA